ncbi:thioredoxin-like protein [Pavlovales sp. CCMP2436]|nr:thioredoxin-like protein [Pavlovales sp. CCMP2436]
MRLCHCVWAFALAALAPAVRAFGSPLPPVVASSRVGRLAMRMAIDDPLASPLVQAVGVLQEALQKSPIATFKKQLAKLQAGSYDEVQTRSQVDSLIADNPVVVFSFTTCPFCIKAKQLLDAKGVTYKSVELNDMADGYAIRAELAERTGRTSVPAVYIGGEYVGGCNDGGMGGIITMDKQGRLATMLKEAGAIAA